MDVYMDVTGGVEPDEVGTRIEDGKGRRWDRVHPHGGSAPWWLVDADPDADSWAVWSAIPEPTYIMVSPTDRANALRAAARRSRVTFRPGSKGGGGDV